ncbi:MAG: hypothetical protein KAW92_09765 [Candidatus Cloacimonetes bacterium]|nr:hypothetical protein [Candidatus Cloacimonadota bacterium]
MASLYITRRIRNFLIFGIIIVSLIVAFSRSKIHNLFLKATKTVTASAPKKAINLFNNYNYDTKLDLRFVSNNIIAIKNEVNEVIRNNKLNVLYSISKGDNITKLVELPSDSYLELLSTLMSSPNLASDELIKSQESLSIEGLKRRIQDLEREKEEINKKIIDSRTYQERENYNKAKKELIDNIVTLTRELKEKEQREHYILAKIDISRIISRNIGFTQSIKIFGITFIESLVFISIALFICYLIILGLTKIFKVLGIRTSSGSESRYGRYGSKSYDYGDYSDSGYGEKRIKRKYIRKPIHKDEGSESEKDENNKTDLDK